MINTGGGGTTQDTFMTDGVVDPNNSPKAQQPLSATDLKVNFWKKEILRGK